MITQELVDFGLRHIVRGDKIGFVADEKNGWLAIATIFMDFREPNSEIQKGSIIGHIIDHHNGISPAIIHINEGFETLLASCVPDLKPISTIAQGNIFHPKINANRHVRVNFQSPRARSI